MSDSLPPSYPFDQQYEDLLRDAITQVKGGHKARARRLLERATLERADDARAWVWLSATTDDPQEQRQFLERAVAADPSNAAARRGLVMLTDQLKGERVLAEGEQVQPRRPQQPEQAQGVAQLCPQCGGSLQFSAATQELTCTRCGFIQVTQKHTGAERLEQPMDFTLPTERGHRWAEAQQQVTCEQCGAISLLPPGQTADRCAYCGSNRMVKSAQQSELVDPQAVVLFCVDETQALRQVKDWLGKGWFSPDDLRDKSGRLQLREAYYPFWTFDGMLELPWTCEVNEGTSRSPHWVGRNGVEMKFFDDVLVPGLRKINLPTVEALEPFNLKEAVEFSPDYLVGWTALTYDYPLSDASLRGREKVVKRLRQSLYANVEPGKEKRNLNSGGGKWSGLTFKNLFLPLWVGTYHFQGQDYPVMVNGQTGKVSGTKPRDNLKLVLIVSAAVVTIVVVLAVLVQLLPLLGLGQ